MPPDDEPLLVAPLLLPTTGWTSRTVAELTGHSQSAVARAWRRAHPAAGHPRLAALPPAGLRLEAAAAHAGNSVLVLSAAPGPHTAFAGAVMRSPRRAPLQALLATAVLARRRAAGGVDLVAADPGPDRALVERTRRRVPSSRALYVITQRPVAAPAQATEVVVDRVTWQALLGDLVRRCTAGATAELVAAQHLAMEWARGGTPRFEWSLPAAEVTALRPARPAAPRAASQVLVDDVLAVLVAGLRAGRLRGGDHVSETSLARAAHASRGHVRDALRTLASSGLVELEADRGAVIPVPQTADVLETYAARRALGTVVVRRASHATALALRPAEEALAELLATGATGDPWVTGEADLRFQDVLAGCTGMRRVPQMFALLTTQIRLFLAVMGLDYTYSVPGMCRDDSLLLDLVRAHDEPGAVRAWNRKVDDATTYMTTQLTVSSPGPPGRTRRSARR